MKKYGRTYHLPISPGTTNDDKILDDLSVLTSSSDVVITEKMDGENTTIHRNGCFARSPDSGYHASRDWVKAFAAGVSPLLDADERIVGEYVFARHSISYDALPSYFLGFAWIRDGEFQSWDKTLARFQEIGVTPVTELYRGPFDLLVAEDLCGKLNFKSQEGFVVRVAGSFSEDEMKHHVAKYVRANHVESDEHWMQAEIVRNKLK